MITGFTGSRWGMTPRQRDTLGWVLDHERQTGAPGAREFHHGDCVGADEQAAAVARSLGYKIIGHPPLVEKLRAHFPSDEETAPLPYEQRDQAIVDAVMNMLATPHGPEVRRSGTWMTIRYARHRKVPRLIIEPDGTYHLDPI